MVGFHLDEVASDGSLATTLVSSGLWAAIVEAWGGKIVWHGDRGLAVFGGSPFSGMVVQVGFLLWLAGAELLSKINNRSWRECLCEFGLWGWLWWLTPVLLWGLEILGAWGWLGTEFPILLRGSLPFWNAVLVAGWGSTWIALAIRNGSRDRELHSGSNTPADSLPVSSAARIPVVLWGAMGLYVLAFGWMNWRLYDSLMLPHGDSAMYEEHLWNLLHGKGFRSYLDNGRLFLGEHVQVVHVLLVPLYLLWPSHVLLELVQSIALAAGAIPVFRIALRSTGSRNAAILLGMAYLLYFPMQFLDIAIDFKTFRPNGFEIPFLLFSLDALESRRYRSLAIWLLLAMLCQEDAATVIAPLGLWIACCGAGPNREADRNERRRVRFMGVALAVGGVIWVLLVIKVILPFFRGGADVHFAQYFSNLGDNTDSIVTTVLKQPMAVMGRILRAESGLFAVALLAPLGWVALLSPGRLAVAVPLFCVLCLSDITDSPQHHFHAPLVPILFWAAAHGVPRGARWRRAIGVRLGIASPQTAARSAPPVLMVANGKSLPVVGQVAAAATSPPRAGAVLRKLRRREPRRSAASTGTGFVVPTAVWVLLSAGVTGFWIGLSPLSLTFWDPHSSAYWRKMYVPGDRARHVATVVEQVPKTARVASTDLIHPRFTHYERSYDYSAYRPIVPDDCEYIVIDMKSPGSGIHGPQDVKELRDAPNRWRLLPDKTDGHFLILRRVVE